MNKVCIPREFGDECVTLEVFDKHHLFLSASNVVVKITYNKETMNRLKDFINAI